MIRADEPEPAAANGNTAPPPPTRPRPSDTWPGSSRAPGRNLIAPLYTARAIGKHPNRPYLTNEFGLWYFFTMPMNKVKLLIAGAFLALALATGASAASSSTNLSLVAYSTPKTVMGKIIQAWQQTADGKGVSFTQSYGASSDQARAVAAGLKADLVFLSTGDDVNMLVDAGLVDRSGTSSPTRGSRRTPSSSSPSATATRSTSRAGPT